MVTVAKPKGRSSALRRPIPKSALAAIERDRWIGYPIGDAGLFRLNELYTMRARVRMPFEPTGFHRKVSVRYIELPPFPGLSWR
jgi:hypothetical protein